MSLFEFEMIDDELAVLSAYATVQDAADARRKAEQRESEQAVERSDSEAAGPDEETVEDEPPATLPASAPVRTHTWVSRLAEVEGIPADRMAPIHGRLIAHGLLQFQLQGREEGVVYRVTSAGRKALSVQQVEAEAA